MALTSVNLTNILGLNTEGSPLDVTLRPPNSLYTAKNIAFNHAGLANGRKGHPVRLEIPSTLVGYNAVNWYNFNYTNVNATQFLIPYTPASDATAIQFISWDNSSTSAYTEYSAAKQYYINGIGATSTATLYLLPAVGSNNLDTHWIDAQGRYYVMCPNGLFTTAYNTTLSSDNTAITKLLPVIINSITTALDSTAGTWFIAGKTFKTKAVIDVYYPSGGYYESPVAIAMTSLGSSPAKYQDTLTNVGNNQGAKFTSTIDVSNIRDLTYAILRVYRTLQYDTTGVENTEYYLCYETALDKGTTATTAWKTVFTDIALTATDDLIRQNATLYTSINNDGSIGEHTTIPAANDIATYKGYTIYGGVKLAPYFKTKMSALPTAADSLNVNGTVILSATPEPFTNQAIAPSGFSMSESDLTFRGKLGTANFVCIRPIDPNDSNQTAATNSVPFNAITKAATAIAYYGTNGALTIKMSVTGIFDTSQFQAPGMLAIVKIASTPGKVLDIISYRDFEHIATSNTVDFYECTSVAGVTGYAFANAEQYYVYYLPGTSIDNLPVYPLSSDAITTGGLVTYLSLLPVYYTYPTQKGWQTPIGRLGGTTGLSSTVPQFKAEFFGVKWRSVAKQLDDATKDLVYKFNAARTMPYQPYARLTGEVGEIYLTGTLTGESGVTGSESTAGKYDVMNVNIYPATTLRFSDTISTTNGVYTDMSEAVDIPNGICISKTNRPETVGVGQTFTPIRIGNDASAIQRVAVNNDQCYIFKQNEGIYRIELIEGAINPELSAIAVIDNTIWLTAANSLQQIDESFYFLSNKGVARLNNNQIEIISQAIEGDLREEFTKGSAAHYNIKSFGNDFKRQYAVSFPVSGNTYVFDIRTGRWSMWDIKFTQALCTPNGKLTTVSQSISGAVTWSVFKQDIFTLGYEDTVDQYEEKQILTGTTIVYTSATKTLSITGLALSTTQIGTKLTNLLDRYAIASGIYKAYLYDTSAAAFVPLTYVSSNTGTGNITFTCDTTPASTPAVTDYIYIGVNVSVTSNRFFTGGASTLNQFAECHYQLLGLHSYVKVGFEADNPTPTFASSGYSTNNPTYDIIRTLVPRNQARGRWIMTNIKHDFPQQNFVLAGISWVYKDVASFRVKLRNV